MKTIHKILFIGLFGILISEKMGAQANISYDSAKSYMHSQRFADAAKKWNDWLANNPKHEAVPYANYYLALSYFKLGKWRDANFQLFQLINKFPTWNKMDYAYYLKGIIQLESKNYADGLQQLNKISNSSLKSETSKFKKYFFKQFTEDSLLILLNRYPEDKDLQNVALSQKITSSRARKVINVAVLFPFENALKTVFIYELYQGLQLAADSLQKAGIKINLVPFETDKDSVKIKEFTNLQGVENFDLIIGPIYNAQQKFIQDFAIKNQIPVVNPLANLTSYTNNPFYFLFQPSFENQGRAAANFAFHNFKRRATVAIIYMSKTEDSLMARAYKETFEQLGGKVLIYKKISKWSMGNMSAVFGKTRLDSIGHIFVSATEQSLASNVLGYLESSLLEKAKAYKESMTNTTDNNQKLSLSDIPLIVPKEWLDFQSFGYDQLEMHNTHFIYPNFFDLDSLPNQYVKKNYVNYSNLPASSFVYQGFDLMLFFGMNLQKGGGKFNKYLKFKNKTVGYALPEIDYRLNNSNSSVSIVKIQEYKLEIVNKSKNVE
jgi:Periplasmic binding protein/Outer membrane lipoprotein